MDGQLQGTQFTTTHWSAVLEAGKGGSPAASMALEQLCRTYWYPLYAYIRRRGFGHEDSQDLTQEFLEQLLRKNYPARADRAKGKFRTFLLHTLTEFLADSHKRAAAQKRGGNQIIIPLDAESPDDRYRLEIPDELTPERVYERRWAQSLLDRALVRLRAEYVAGGKEVAYDLLSQFEPGEQSLLSYAEAATRLSVSESAVKSMIHRLRQRHRELVREEIAQTVSSIAEIDEELRHLVSALRD
jgi:RNA polymerase sigma factor (sigma-70 family)